MLWVSGGIIIHGLEQFHLTPLPHLVEALKLWAGSVPMVGMITGWAAGALASAGVGLALGAVIVGVLHLIPRKR